jgi:aspartyl-tRNA(Asn)/glutamyl-tRNA(Gln) amidotransferase subunit C
MITREEITKLANLARIEVTEDEKDQFSREIDSILEYINQLEKVALKVDSENISLENNNPVKNVMRDDTEQDSGIYTDKIIAEMPEKMNNYLKVKNIL